MAPSFSNLRPGYPICPPAVARHVVFRLAIEENPRWPPSHDRGADPQAGKKPGSSEEKWDALCGRLTDHLKDLRRAYEADEKVEVCRPEVESDAEAHRFSTRASCLVPISTDEARGFRLRVRIDVHTELLTLTYIFDQIKAGSLKAHIDGLKLDGPEPKERPASKWLFDTIWKGDENGAGKVPAAEALDDWLDLPGVVDRHALITDFRGIVICPDDEWDMDQPDLDEATTRRKRRRRLVRPLASFAQQHEDLIRAVADPYSIDRKAKTAADPSGHACAQGGEPVVCGMLDGKALYAAALGEWGKHVETPQPIRHLLVYAGHSYSQLGRLVRRMQVLGELRHAAVMDYDADKGGAGGLREASRAIRLLGGELNRATSRITETEDGKDDARTAGEPATPMKELQHFVSRLGAISGMVEGGLTHRVEQSRYYAGELQEAIKHLRLVRIGDWQPYDDFVQRYILHLFARIDRIGNRYEALGRRVDRLLFFQQAKALDSYTQNVKSTVAQIRKSTEALNKSARLQTELLQVAEFFAIVFLIYYVGSVFHYRYAEERVIWSIGKGEFLVGWSWLIGSLGTLLGGVLVFRFVRRVVGSFYRSDHVAHEGTVDPLQMPERAGDDQITDNASASRPVP